jgi:hypothetical protein
MSRKTRLGIARRLHEWSNNLMRLSNAVAAPRNAEKEASEIAAWKELTERETAACGAERKSVTFRRGAEIIARPQ